MDSDVHVFINSWWTLLKNARFHCLPKTFNRISNHFFVLRTYSYFIFIGWAMVLWFSFGALRFDYELHLSFLTFRFVLSRLVLPSFSYASSD